MKNQRIMQLIHIKFPGGVFQGLGICPISKNRKKDDSSDGY
jgi:hypothetical protein